VGTHTAGGTAWSVGKSLNPNPAPNVAQSSQLAVARPDKDDKTLRIFYQEPKTNNKSPIREIKYSKAQQAWKVQPGKIEGAAENTRLSAVSAGSNSNLRIYYEGSDRYLWVSHWNANSGSWNTGKFDTLSYYHESQSLTIMNVAKHVDWDWKIATNAPIVATCWFNGSADEIENIRIRVYTILDENKIQIAEIARDGEEWSDQSKSVATIETGQGTPATNAIGVSRENKAAEDAPIFILYKPRKAFLSVTFSGTNSATISEAVTAYAPMGLPTSRY
jgi:hypothetical protein